MSDQRTITLTTDFGVRDAYVGAMKGVLLTRSPGSAVVDITHDIPPQDLIKAALVLKESVGYFPPGTVHLVVVDPGVGTSRDILIVEWGDQILVAPDNGVLTPLLDGRDDWRSFRLERGDLALSQVSNTFHGRDLFAPVTAALASGEVRPDECGPAHEPLRLEIPSVVRGKSGLEGEILRTDCFGNLITNIHAEDIEGLERPFQVHVEARPIETIVSTYGAARSGELVALVGSSGWLEIAVVNGSAAERLELERGRVTLSMV